MTNKGNNCGWGFDLVASKINKNQNWQITDHKIRKSFIRAIRKIKKLKKVPLGPIFSWHQHFLDVVIYRKCMNKFAPSPYKPQGMILKHYRLVDFCQISTIL